MSLAPRVHVLLVNFNGWRDTVECLKSLLRLDYPDCRVIVLDNGSDDGSLAHLQSWAAEAALSVLAYDRQQAQAGGTAGAEAALIFIRVEDNLGFAGGNNVGLRYLRARGETGFVLLLNNDTVIEPLALRHMVDAIEATPGAAAAGATVYWYDQPESVQVDGGGLVSLWTGFSRLGPDRFGRVDFISGACMLVRLAAIDTVGLLDERYFMYSEEVDWCLRMRSAGFALVRAPEARVRHKEGRSVRRHPARRDYYTTRSALLLVQKFRPARVPVAFAWSIYRSVMPKIVRGEGKRLRAVLAAQKDFIVAWISRRPQSLGRPRL